MFANLKNKLIEEVKASPSKFQQFANAAQAAVSSSSSTTPTSETNTSSNNENFFSITEEDTPQNSPYRIQKLPATSASSLRGRSSTQSLNGVGLSGGATPRTRKLSNSSMASDVSFRLPSYDAPAVYHLQSDLDETSSEFDDSASTARLDVITKDQLYDAYKKSLDRYHKYRCRYTDLAKKYKDLERDSSKARSVLVETQDKALRRISELREQCTLEQQAKAHLEEALRIEMDDMSCKMQAYQTKLKLLGENPDNIAAALERSGQSQDSEKLIDLDESAGKSPPPPANTNGAPTEDVSRLQELLKDRETQLQEVKEKYEALRKQEEENVLLLAQTKQAIHTELEHKDTEVSQLQEKLKQLELQRETHTNEAKEQLKKLQATKQEVEAKLIATEHLLSTLKGNFAAKEQQVVTLEKQLEIFKTESEQKLKALEKENQESDSSEQLKQLQSAKEKAEASLESLRSQQADQEAQLKALTEELATLRKENEQNLAKLQQTSKESESQSKQNQENQRILQAAKEETEAKLLETEEQLNSLRKEHKTQTEELTKLQEKLSENEKNLEKLQQNNQESESQTSEAQEQLRKLQAGKEEAEHSLKALQAALSSKEEQAASLEQQLSSLQTDSQQSLQDLRLHNDQLLEIVQRHQQNDWESQLQVAKEELKQREQRSLELEKNLEMERESLAALSSEKIALEEQHRLKLEQLNRELQILQDQHAHTESETVAALKTQLEALSQDLATSQASLLSKEKELKASGNKLNKMKKQHEQHQSRSSEQAARLELLQKDLTDRQNHSRQVESEKEELQARVTGILEEIATMQRQMQQVQDSHSELEREKRKLESRIESLQQEQVDSTAQDERTSAKLEEIQSDNTKLAERNCLLEEQANYLESQLQDKQDEMGKIQVKMQQVLDEHSKLQNAQELMDHDHRTLQDKCDAYEKDKLLTKDQLEELQRIKANLERDLEEQQQTKANLERDLEGQQEELMKLRDCEREQEQQLRDQEERCSELETSRSRMQDEISNLQELLANTQLQAEQGDQEKIQAASASYTTQIENLEARWSAANADVERLHEANDALQLEMEQLKTRHSQDKEDVKESIAQKNRQVVELQEKLALRDRELTEKVDNTQKLAKFEELQVENECLNKHTKHLEQELAEAAEVKEKLKSLQCELYVLQEKAEQHAVQVSEKETQSAAAKAEAVELKRAIEEQAVELTRQKEHASFVTEQSDAVQKDLLQAQHQLQEKQTELAQSHEELASLKATIEGLSLEVTTLKEQAAATLDSDGLRSLNERLQRELEDLRHKSNGAESNMQQEIEELQANNQQMAERINELETLRAGIQAQQLLASMAPKTQQQEDPAKAELEAKLKEIMSEVQDVTNRNLFLEQKCENFLILEQSNERLKLQNAKLSRQLDETLVSMQHSESVPANTEFEYLRNIMFQYLTGNTNNETLVKVISAVLKFSPQQAQVALEKEHQRRSLLNKLI
ncbi:golgin subfamily A member 4 [Drosophila kikkawai]|uniref:Golgin subfamily A member 4 n=1 Tax=Drosophila kikkawai TaxID=30033 RepID=A0A6P4ID45_DROKI|nr:golgin subfamily A member 4 [Drosophila kikkawai]